MKIRGIQCENTRRIVDRATRRGWVYDGVTRGSHGQLRWPATGALVHFGFTPSDRNSWKRLAKRLEDASGITLWQRTKHGAGHRRPSSTPAESARVQRDRAPFSAEADRQAQLVAAEQRRRDITSLMRGPG